MTDRAMRSIVIAVLLLTSSAPGASSILALQPVAPWRLIPNNAECRVERVYAKAEGSTVLGVIESPSRQSYRLVIATNDKGSPGFKEYGGLIETAAGTLKRWSLHYTLKASGSDVFVFGLTAAEMSQAASGESLGVSVAASFNETFGQTGLANALRDLDSCVMKLRSEWHVDGQGYEAGTKPARGDVRRLFQDVRAQGMRSGKVQFTLLIDESGKIAGCDVERTAGALLMEFQGCRLLQDKAAFDPARDPRGQAIKDFYRTPFIVVN
jgi:hypothetical protein